jgi:hypothetical protein
VREAARQAARLGIAADVLDAGPALHSPAVARCAAPLRSVLAQVRLGPPSRRLVSTVTARELTARDDIAALLWAQLTSPVRFAEALRAVAADADLLFVAGTGTSPDPSALAWCGVPTTGLPARGGPGAGRPGVSWDGPGSGGGPLGSDAAADRAVALFAAGAMPSAAPLAMGAAAQPADIWRDRYLGLGAAAPVSSVGRDTPRRDRAGRDTAGQNTGPLHPGGGASTDASIWWGGPREPVLTGITGDDGATRPAYVAREPVS